MYIGCWAGITYLGYTALTSSSKSETAVHTLRAVSNNSCDIAGQPVFIWKSFPLRLRDKVCTMWVPHVCVTDFVENWFFEFLIIHVTLCANPFKYMEIISLEIA